jgi:hypothetical protein
MTDKPEALRLADVLQDGDNFYAESSLWYDGKLAAAAWDAAAELRRLHDVEKAYESACKIIGEQDKKLVEMDLIAAAQREKVAHWMRSLGYATGHGDTTEDLLDHLGTQISEGLEAEALMERMACARVCDEHASVEGIAQRCAEQIRARSKT